MHPILFKIGSVEIHTFGVLLTMSFLVGMKYVSIRARKFNIAEDVVMNLAVLIMLSALIGSRAMYVLFHMNEFRGRYWDIINPFQSSGSIGIAGLTLLGGVILAVVTTVGYLHQKRLPTVLVGDLLAPALALGLFISRLGCYFNGCCFGNPTSGPFGVIFPAEGMAGFIFSNTPIHPTQLYLSLAGLTIFCILLFMAKMNLPRGAVLYSLSLLYGIDRFFIDFFRYYEEEMIFMRIGDVPFSVNQGICILLIAFGLTALGRLLKSTAKIRAGTARMKEI